MVGGAPRTSRLRGRGGRGWRGLRLRAGRLRLAVPAERREAQDEAHEHEPARARGPPRVPRVARGPHAPRAPRRDEEEVRRERDHDDAEDHRHPHPEERPRALRAHRDINRMIASAGSPSASSSALRATAFETSAFSATRSTSSSEIAGFSGGGAPSLFRVITIGSPTTCQVFCPCTVIALTSADLNTYSFVAGRVPTP